MARSITRAATLVGLLAWAAATAAPTTTPVAPAQRAGEQPINLDAASSEVDYKTNTVVFSDVTISQGETRVQAEHARATGLNFANSKWTFEGKVRIDAEARGNLRSDSAVVEFRDNHISKATVNGKPAEFEQKRAGSEQVARGHADQIVYDVGEGTVRLTEDAWLSDGQSQISGPLLVYNIRGEKVQAVTTPGTDQRVHITITPRTAPPAGKDPGKPPGPDAGKPPATPQP
jgi:lipopolysaccharide transport protein LptA